MTQRAGERAGEDDRLVTKAEYDALSPRSQGYIAYWQGDRAGSELHGLKNPYAAGTPAHEAWNFGQTVATQNAQDSEE